MSNLCESFGFKQHNSSMYNAPTNGLIEAFNKTFCNLLKKIVDKSKRDWHERVGKHFGHIERLHKQPLIPSFMV